MNPLALLWLWRIGSALLLAGSLTAGYFGWAHHEQSIGAAPYIAAIAKQKGEAAQVLTAESAKAAAATKALKDFKTTQELKDVDHQKTVSALNANLHRLAGVSGRLRDPAGCGDGNSSTKGSDSTSAVDSAGNTSDASGVLSKQLTELLLGITKSADAINDAYESCRADAFSVRSTQGELIDYSLTPAKLSTTPLTKP